MLLQQPNLRIDTCEYEVDLGNGRITSYQSNDKQQQQQRITSIVSVDSIQPTTTFKIPLTNTYSQQCIHPKQKTSIDESNLLFRTHNYVQQRQTKLPIRTVIILSISAIISVLIIVVILFVI